MTTIPPSKGGGNGGLGPGPAALLLTTAAPEQSRCFSFCFGSKILLGSFANTRQHILPEHGWKSQPLWATGLDLPSLPAGRTPSVTCIPLGRRKDLGTVVLSGLLPYPPMCWKRNHTVVVTGCFKRLSRWHCALPFRADRRERGHFLGLFFFRMPSCVPHLFWFGCGLGNFFWINVIWRTLCLSGPWRKMTTSKTLSVGGTFWGPLNTGNSKARRVLCHTYSLSFLSLFMDLWTVADTYNSRRKTEKSGRSQLLGEPWVRCSKPT